MVFHDVTNPVHGKKAADAGVDGLIAVAAGAGGHAGTTNPFALVAELRSFFKKTLILAGGLSTGRDIAAAQMLGADLAYMGTRFIATHESLAPDEYKQMILAAQAGDIVHTPAVSGIPANFLKQSLEKNGFDLKRLSEPASAHLGEKLTLDKEAKAWKTVWSAGHGVSAIHEILPAQTLVDRLHEEYNQAIREFSEIPKLLRHGPGL
jgi:nitronate monooxygenase